MPIADARRIVSGADDAQRQQIFIDHRARLEARLFVPWTGEGPPPPQSFYVYVDDPEMVCAEFEQAGANILDSVALRPYGMRDFTLLDPDGHRFTLGRGDETLRDVADQYGLDRDEIAVDPAWLQRRQPN